MYSDMSMRTMARSSSKRKSASVRASSVLPTPVGPRNRKEPIGRLGSDSPARDRRIALATAVTASSWPMTRSCSTSSMRTSFAISPSMSRLTGMPVHLATISAMSSSSTSSLSIAARAWSSSRRSASPRSRPRGRASCRSAAGRRARGRPRARRARPRVRAFSSCSLSARISVMASFSFCQCATIASRSSASVASSSSIAASRCCRRRRSPWQRGLLDLELADAPLDHVDLERHRVDLDAQARTRPRRRGRWPCRGAGGR